VTCFAEVISVTFGGFITKAVSLTAVSAISGGTGSPLLGQVAGAATTELLESLVGVQAEQLELLKGIRADLTIIRKGPWETARSYIRRATYPDLSEAQILQELGEARRYLYEAAPLQIRGSWERVAVEIELTLVLSALHDRFAARDAALTAWNEGVAAMVNEAYPYKKIRAHDVGKRYKENLFRDQLTLAAQAELTHRGYNYKNTRLPVESAEFFSSSTLAQYPQVQGPRRLFYMAETLEQLRVLCCALDPGTFADISKPHFSVLFYVPGYGGMAELRIVGHWPIEHLEATTRELLNPTHPHYKTPISPLWFVRSEKYANHFYALGIPKSTFTPKITIDRFIEQWHEQYQEWFPSIKRHKPWYHVATEPEILRFLEQPPGSVSAS
jgi:hypothetical protein